MKKKIILIFLLLLIMCNTVIYAESKDIKNDLLWLYFLPTDLDFENITNTDQKTKDVSIYDTELTEEIENEISKNAIEEFEESDSDIRYDIIGYFNDDWKSTTYGNGGYATFLKVNNYIPVQLEFNNTTIHSIQNDINCSFVNNGNFVKIEYNLKNIGNEEATISLGTYADVQIGSNDYATIERMINDMGLNLYSEEDNIQFKFYGKNTEGVTNIDRLWIGTFPDETEHFLNENSVQKLENVDSSFSFSWIDRKIAPNETQKYSVLIGIGKMTSVPIIELDKDTNERFNINEVILKGVVKDNDEDSRAVIHYSLDDNEDVISNEYKLINNKYNFEIDLTRQNLSSGKHNIKIWAIDDQGNISNIIEKDFYITDLDVPILNMSEDWSKSSVKFTISDTDSNKQKVSKYQYKIDDGEWKDIDLDEEKVALDQTGTCNVYIKAIGKNGNDESPIIMKTAKVDKLAPEIAVSLKDSKIKIDAIDKNSGMDYVQYLITNKEEISDSDEFIKYEKEFSYNSTYNGKLYLHIRAYDKVGNSSESIEEYDAPVAATIECNSSFKDKDAKFKIVDNKNQNKNGYEYYVRLNGGDWNLANIDTYYDIKNSVVGTNTIETKTVDIFKRESSISKKTYEFEVTKNEATTNKEIKSNNVANNINTNTEKKGNVTQSVTPNQTYFIKSSNDDTIAKNIIPKTGTKNVFKFIFIALVFSIFTLVKYTKLKKNMKF